MRERGVERENERKREWGKETLSVSLSSLFFRLFLKERKRE